MKKAPILVLLALSAAALWAQAPAPATAAGTRSYVETLASERFAGREAGSTGERQAGDFIAAQLARIGARPLPGRQDVFMSFDFTAGSRDGGNGQYQESSFHEKTIVHDEGRVSPALAVGRV